jgi:hypothetical protein
MATGGATWIVNWFRPTVTAAMLTCLVVAIVELAARIVPGWRGPHYVAFAFLVSWEGIQSERLLRYRGPSFSDRFRYRAVEAIIILLLFKLIFYVPLGWDALWTDVLRWTWEPTAFLDAGFVLGGAGVIVLWVTAIVVTKSLHLLEVHPSEIPPDPGQPNYDRWTSTRGQPLDRQAVLGDIVHYYFFGGVMLLLLTGLARFDILILYQDGPPPLSGLVVNAMLYLILGLVLISQARFSILQASWRIGRIDVSPQLGTRWAWLAVIFLILILAVALVLPTGYSVGLPQAIAFIVTAPINVVSFIISSLLYFLALLFGLILNALGMQTAPIARQTPPPAQLPSLPPGDPGSTSGLAWFELFKSILFWGILAAILAYSVYHFFQERQGLLPGLGEGLLARLIAWLRGLWQRGRRWPALARQAVARRLGRRPGLRERWESWRIVRLSHLSPRQRVRYFYLSVLRRATRAGHSRSPQQTPYEYGTVLTRHVPETETDVTTLTQAFVEARYSQHPVDEQDANVIKRVWRRIRATLARKRHS